MGWCERNRSGIQHLQTSVITRMVLRWTIDKRDREGKVNGTLRERERERWREGRGYLIFVGFVLLDSQLVPRKEDARLGSARLQ